MIVGLDAGTSVVKAAAFDETGAALGVASRPMSTAAPHPSWREQDPEAVIEAAAGALSELTRRLRQPVEVVGITGQGDGVWLLDAVGRAVRPAVLWSDGRAAELVDRWLATGRADDLFARSANGLFPGAAGPVLAWLARHEPASLERATTAAYCKDMLFQRLTGVRATDLSDASGSFVDIRARRYDPIALDGYGLSPWTHLLAPIAEGPALLQPLRDTGAALTGLAAGTPVHAGPFDLVATPLGAGLASVGDALVILGTTLGCCVLVDAVPDAGPPVGMTLCLPHPDRHVRVMAASTGTPSLDWALPLLGADRAELDRLLGESPPGARGVVALPLLAPAGERAPFIEPAARGSFHGLTLQTTRADLVRAVCEGVAMVARHCLQAAGMGPDGAVWVTGGGSRSRAWRQTLADVLGRPLRVAREPEVGARGAALAGLAATGVVADPAWTTPDETVEPRAELRQRYDAAFAEHLAQIDRERAGWTASHRTTSAQST